MVDANAHPVVVSDLAKGHSHSQFIGNTLSSTLPRYSPYLEVLATGAGSTDATTQWATDFQCRGISQSNPQRDLQARRNVARYCPAAGAPAQVPEYLGMISS